MSMKNSNDTIGNRTRDLPAYSAVPQPTAPPGAPYFTQAITYLNCAIWLVMNIFVTICNNAFGAIVLVHSSIITNRLNLLITSFVHPTCFGNILPSSGYVLTYPETEVFNVSKARVSSVNWHRLGLLSYCSLGASAKLWKATISFLVYVRVEQVGSHRSDFHEIWYLMVFRKPVEKIEVSLTHGKNNGYFIQ